MSNCNCKCKCCVQEDERNYNDILNEIDSKIVTKRLQDSIIVDDDMFLTYRNGLVKDLQYRDQMLWEYGIDNLMRRDSIVVPRSEYQRYIAAIQRRKV